MRSLLATVIALAALLACGPAASLASTPPSNPSVIPAFIRLVGADAFGKPDTAGSFTVTVRDFMNNPVAGSHVMVDFAGATDLAPCPVQAPGTTITPYGVMGVTDQNGVVTMTILGHALPNAPPSSAQALAIVADGVILGRIPGCAFDLDGASGMSGGDLSLWLADFVAATNPPRGDYDGNGLLGGSDLSRWLQAFVGAGSAQSCPPVVTAPD
jgi:hypothetical protein